LFAAMLAVTTLSPESISIHQRYILRAKGALLKSAPFAPITDLKANLFK